MKKILFTTIATAIIAITSYLPVQGALVLPKPTPDSAATASAMKEDAMKNALNEFKSLSKKERSQRLKEAKAVLKKYKADKKAGNSTADTNTILLVILSIILPPLAVYLHENAVNGKFWLDLILTLIFWLPGLIYALVVVLSK